MKDNTFLNYKFCVICMSYNKINPYSSLLQHNQQKKNFIKGSFHIDTLSSVQLVILF